MIKQNPFDQGYYNSNDLLEMGFKSVGKNVQIAKNCTIIGLENISIGNNVRIDGGVTFACASGYLEIGNHIHIGSNSFLLCSGGIEIKDFSNISQNVKIYSASDDVSGKHLTNPTIPKEFLNVIKKSYIRATLFLGSSTVVLPGVNIGEGSSVGALSLVTKSLNDWGINAGIPCKRIKKRSEDLLLMEKSLLKKYDNNE